MAIVMLMHWDGVTADEYENVRAIVNWEGDPPPGGSLHIAAVDESGLYVTDLWDTAEAFQTFVATRLMPGVQQAGLNRGEPKVTILPVHAISAPGYQPV